MKLSPFHIIIKINQSVNDRITTESGITFFKGDLEHNTEDNTRTFGEVVAVPEKNKSIRPHLILKNIKGNITVKHSLDKNHQCRGSSPQLKTPYRVKDIVQEVKVGDRVHFRYLVIDESNIFSNNGELYYACSPIDIFFAERDGEYIMIGGWCMIELMGDGSVELKSNEIIIPDAFSEKVENKKNDRGRLVNIGTPLLGQDKIPCKPGDTVFFPASRVEWLDLNGEGKKIYLVHQEDICAYE